MLDLGLAREAHQDVRRQRDARPRLAESGDQRVLDEIVGKQLDLEDIARLLNATDPKLAGPHYTVNTLKEVARAWMDDMHDYCNIVHSLPGLDPVQCAFTHNLREFRRARPWLRHNFGPKDHFGYIEPLDGRTVFSSLRHGPDGEQVFSVIHMEGKETADVDPLRLGIPGTEAGLPAEVD